MQNKSCKKEKKEKEKFEVALLLPFFSSHIVHIEQPNTQLFQITNIIQKNENKRRPLVEHVCKWQYLVKADRPRKVELDGNQS